MKYVWQLKGWPAFIYGEDAVLQRADECALGAIGLAEEIDSIPDAEKKNAMLDVMAQEAVNTSSIGGVHVGREDVLESIRRHIEKDAAPRKGGASMADGVAELMVSVREHFDEPLTKERLWEWQAMVVDDVDVYGNPIEKGRWRTRGRQVAGLSRWRIVKVDYEAPPPKWVPREMDRFIDWFNNSRGMNGIIRAGLAHAYFESIRPFGDGNGRVGRAISGKALAQDANGPIHFSISAAIKENRSGYIGGLQSAQRYDMDATLWLLWFADYVRRGQEMAVDRVREALRKARLWDKYSTNLNDRQSRFISYMLRQGIQGFKGNAATLQYMKMARCDEKVAVGDLHGLSEMGAIKIEKAPNKATCYKINMEENE